MKGKRRTTRLPEAGTAFAFPIGDGRFSVARVLQDESSELGERYKAVMAASSVWIGNSVPRADDRALRPILRLNHHAWKNRPSVIWVSDAVPEDFILIGNIEPSADDRQLTCDSFGNWRSLTLQPLAQWRWDNDREVVLAEDAAKAKAEDYARTKAADARRKYLSEVTLEELRDHLFFPRWKKYPPHSAVRA